MVTSSNHTISEYLLRKCADDQANRAGRGPGGDDRNPGGYLSEEVAVPLALQLLRHVHPQLVTVVNALRRLTRPVCAANLAGGLGWFTGWDMDPVTSPMTVMLETSGRIGGMPYPAVSKPA
jgi:hypothetical protein